MAVVGRSLGLYANVERLTLLGTGAVGGIDNALDNVIIGNAAANTLSGAGGNDVLNGGAGNDTLVGSIGNDNLVALAGDDVLKGGAGNDVLNGGAGRDVFVFDAGLSRTTNLDRITDFSHADDTFHLENAVFTRLAAGALKATAFWAGTKAHDADDRVIYNKATGVVFYDADGNGAGAAMQFAVLSNKPLLQANDFVVI